MKYREKDSDQKHKKYQEKNVGRFNFSYNEEEITYRTVIPSIPQTLKSMPDEKIFKKKLQQLEEKANKLKEQRKLKKNQLKDGSRNFKKEIADLTSKIELGKKCIELLHSDLAERQHQINEFNNQMNQHKKQLNELQKEQNKVKSGKNYEDMTVRQLTRQQQRLAQKMTLGNLSKREESQIATTLSKIKGYKLTAPEEHKNQDESNRNTQIRHLKQAINKLTKSQQINQKRIKTIQMKIETIQQDLQDFEQQIYQIKHEEKLSKNDDLENEAKKLKQQIYETREEITKLTEQYQKKITQYEYEQQKIKWIQWATQVQDRKNQEWRQEKRKNKLAEKRNNEKVKEGEKPAQNEEQPTKPVEKKKINKYQKEIDATTFLISYCKDLYPTQQKPKTEKEKQQINIEKAIKEGEWARLKGIEIIQSKKTKQAPKPTKQKQKQQKKEPEKKQTQSLFNHDFFTLQAFESVNVLAPSKVEDLEKTIQVLEQKLKYFDQHPEGKQQNDRGRGRNEKYVPEKFKIKNNNKRNVISNSYQDFPAL